jgi:hypothetical protein
MQTSALGDVHIFREFGNTRATTFIIPGSTFGLNALRTRQAIFHGVRWRRFAEPPGYPGRLHHNFSDSSHASCGVEPAEAHLFFFIDHKQALALLLLSK